MTSNASKASGPPALGSTNMTPKELSDYDDIGTAVIVDPYLGFGTHKMNLRFRSPRQVHQSYFKGVVNKFLNHQDYEKAYQELLGCEWFSSVIKRRSKTWQSGLKEHVSSPLYKPRFNLFKGHFSIDFSVLDGVR